MPNPGKNNNSSKQKRILVADDSSTFRRIIREILESNGYTMLEASDGQEALDLAIFESPECIMLDVEMPKIDGLEVCRKLRSHPVTALLPVIFVSCHYTVQEITEGLRAGADDYIIKPFSEIELLARIELVINRNVARLHHSPLTGLPDEVSAEKEIAKKDAPYALCFFDLKDFESYNMRYGYDVGDKLLKQVSRLANSTIHFIGGKGDGLFHCGDDNFLIMTSQDKAERIVDHLIERFDQSIIGLHGSIEVKGDIKAPTSLNAAILMVNNSDHYHKKLREMAQELMRKEQNRNSSTVVIKIID